MERVLSAIKRLEAKIDGVSTAVQVPSEKGVLKRMDSLGRITIPITFRKLIEIDKDTDLEISCLDNKIIISRADSKGKED